MENFLSLLADVYTGGDVEALLERLAQEVQNHSRPEEEQG
jgi:hypothetical protein